RILKLNIEKNIRDDHQAELTVEVEAEKMEAMKRRAARKISERGKIPGFRPGKAPYDVIRRYYGDEQIVETAVDMLVDEIYPEVLKQAEIEPAAMGALEKIESVDPPKFVFRVPMQPSVDLGDYLSIRLPYDFVAPGETELNKSLDELRRMYATTETVERAIQEEDYVLMSVKGTKKDAAEGEDQSELSRESVSTVVRAGDKLNDFEWPYKGFCRELPGLKPGESKTIVHEYPADFNDDQLKGATVTFEATIKTVRAVTPPELNDDFAKMVGEQYESLDQVKEVLQKENEARARSDYEDEYFAKLIDMVKEGATLKYPPQVLEHEGEHVLEELQQRLSARGMDLEAYYKSRNTDKEKFHAEEVLPVAKKRLERSLVMDEIARQQKIRFDEESLHAEFDQTIAQMAYQGMDVSQLAKGSKKQQENLSMAIANESAARLITRRTLERLKTIAAGEWTPDLLEEKAEAVVEESAETVAESSAGPAAEASESAAPAEVKEEASESKAE
ncbi:MAG: trigger factor, partial [Chloroflexota bacterium]